MGNLLKVINKKNIILVDFLIVIVLFTRYNIVLDLILIGLVGISSFCIGSYFSVKGSIFEKTIIQVALGMGINGVIIYYILLIGIGGKSIYIILLLTTIILRVKYLQTFFSIHSNFLKTICVNNFIMFQVFLFIVMFYILYGSAPIEAYDSLTKHLPITVYAANNGKWYTNIIESIVYGESMVMQYTFSAMFYTLGAYKALILFNVILNFIVYAILVDICKKIYINTNIKLLTLIYFSTPMFFEVSTIFYLEIIPLFFYFCALSCIITFDKKKVWENLPYISFLAGCSLFAKLTISYSILLLGMIAIVLGLSYAYKAISFLGVMCKIFICGLCLFIPFLTSIVTMWYKVGNPLLPIYNGFFKSPYFNMENFVDPFNANPLSLSIRTLINIVFHTSQNIEMHDGGLGIILLLVFIIPIAMFIYSDNKYILWSIVPFITFSLSCIFTYNLRYFIAIFIFIICMIIIGISIIIDYIKIRGKKYIFVVICIALAIPNIIYIHKCYSITTKLKPDKRVTSNMNDHILSTVGKDKRVLSLNDPFKGDYEGFYNAFMWHNTYTINKINSNELDWLDYIKSFDYVLYKKNVPLIQEVPYIEDLLRNSNKPDSIIEKYAEDDYYILYNVNSSIKDKEVIVESNFVEPKKSRTSTPVTVNIENNWDYYVITQDIENESDLPISMRFQINWHSADGTFLNTNINTFTLNKERGTYTSDVIPKNEDANFAIVYFTTNNDEEVIIHKYKVEGIYDFNYIDDESRKLFKRVLLK